MNLLATSGKDCLIKIWNISSKKVYSLNVNCHKKIKKNSIFSEKLCTVIEIHKTQVNVVRWSPNGRLLVSSGDDGKIIIHSKNHFNRKTKIFYKVFFIFENFQNSVISTSWSPDSNFLTTTSHTNCIVIYAIKKKYIFAKINNQIFTMKGSSWDPLGYFLVTQSDSGGIKIWNIITWKLYKAIEFFSCFKFHLRCFQKLSITPPIWTSCGKYIIFCDNFIIDRKHCVRIFNRTQEFTEYKIFHKDNKLINNIRESPRIYSKNLTFKLSSVVATTTEDGKLFLWAPDFSKIKILIKNLPSKIFTDITWNFDGYNLFLATSIGEVFVISFNSLELGETLKINDHIGAQYFYSKQKKPPNFNILPLIDQKKKSLCKNTLKFSESLGLSRLKKNISRMLKFRKKLEIFRNIYKIEILNNLKYLSENIQKKKLPEKSFLINYIKRFVIFIQSKSNHYFVFESGPICKFPNNVEKIPVILMGNKRFIILIFVDRNYFKIISILKKEFKIITLNYFHQIKDINLKRNFIFIGTTLEIIEILETTYLQKLFFLNFNSVKRSLTKIKVSKLLKNTFKCSGLIVFC